MPIVQAIKVYRGENVELNFTMTPGVDITGWVISLTVAKAYNTPNKTFQSTAVITSGPFGQYTFYLTNGELDRQPDMYVYDVFKTNPGNKRILALGNFEIGADAREP